METLEQSKKIFKVRLFYNYLISLFAVKILGIKELKGAWEARLRQLFHFPDMEK